MIRSFAPASASFSAFRRATAPAPTSTAQPQNATAFVGQTANFSVMATGSVPLAFQWKKNGSAISGATSASYTTPATTTSDHDAKFSVGVRNGVGTVTSQNATLVVKSRDLNGDHLLDVLDLAALASAYETSKTNADLDSSGVVDDVDVNLWLAGF